MPQWRKVSWPRRRATRRPGLRSASPASMIMVRSFDLDPVGPAPLRTRRLAITPPTSNVLSSDRFELLVDAVDEYAIFMLDPDGTIASWNPGAQRIKGYSAEEIVGRSFTVFYTASDNEDGKPERELALAASSGQHRDEGWRVRKDLSVFWANVVINAITDDNGRLLGFAKITRDDTDRKANELLRQQLEVMNERERISIDLQDTVVRHILHASLQLSSARNMTNEPALTSRLMHVVDLLDQTLREIRGVITDLHRDAPTASRMET